MFLKKTLSSRNHAHTSDLVGRKLSVFCPRVRVCGWAAERQLAPALCKVRLSRTAGVLKNVECF